MNTLLILCGLAQLTLCVVATLIPRILRFGPEVGKMGPLMRHLFWTYAGYIMTMNLGMGLLSLLRPRLLLDATPLAAFLTSFIAVYWIARMLIQFVSFSGDAAGTGVRYYRLADAALKLLFVGLATVYTLVAWHNWTGTGL